MNMCHCIITLFTFLTHPSIAHAILLRKTTHISRHITTGHGRCGPAWGHHQGAGPEPLLQRDPAWEWAACPLLCAAAAWYPLLLGDLAEPGYSAEAGRGWLQGCGHWSARSWAIQGSSSPCPYWGTGPWQLPSCCGGYLGAGTPSCDQSIIKWHVFTALPRGPRVPTPGLCTSGSYLHRQNQCCGLRQCEDSSSHCIWRPGPHGLLQLSTPEAAAQPQSAGHGRGRASLLLGQAWWVA